MWHLCRLPLAETNAPWRGAKESCCCFSAVFFFFFSSPRYLLLLPYHTLFNEPLAAGRHGESRRLLIAAKSDKREVRATSASAMTAGGANGPECKHIRQLYRNYPLPPAIWSQSDCDISWCCLESHGLELFLQCLAQPWCWQSRHSKDLCFVFSTDMGVAFREARSSHVYGLRERVFNCVCEIEKMISKPQYMNYGQSIGEDHYTVSQWWQPGSQ